LKKVGLKLKGRTLRVRPWYIIAVIDDKKSMVNKFRRYYIEISNCRAAHGSMAQLGTTITVDMEQGCDE
jgi:hypothetical protein